LQTQVACDVDVRGAHLGTCRKVGQRQGHIDVVRHEVQHTRIKAPHGVAEQAPEVGLSPVLLG
ncbi:MAG: hypothetical protein RLZZ498_1964, partial [Pseudomonadota bacterium]